ncbi:MAG: tetratricopeptide (TPR) repeat protein [Maribacter sp.]|jgi:tetratricopeptide (TPR) repeat protein
MPIKKSVISSNVYVAFRSLPKKGWTDIIKLYESKQEDINLLSSAKRLDILDMYLEALHEIKDFKKLKKEVQCLIYLSLSEEIPVEIGLPYYQAALFWKADACFQMREYKEAQYILEQIIRMNPNNTLYSGKLVKCFYWDKPNYIYRFRAFSILLFFLAAAVIIIEFLIIKPFYSEYSAFIMMLRSGLFLSALGIVGAIEMLHWFCSECKVWKVKR